MMKIAVCDDDAVFLQSTVSMIEKWSQQSGVPVQICCFDNGDDLLNKNMVERMDIVFLDIIMPLLNGMDTAKELRQSDKAVQIIFLTSSSEFALEAFEVKARGYLLKPISYEKLKEQLDDCSHNFHAEPNYLVLKTEFGYQKLYYRDIEYIEAQNKLVLFYMRNGKVLSTVNLLRSFESKLDSSEGFFKCHRSYIVSIPNVDTFNMSEIITRSGHRIPIARGYGKAFQEAYFAFMFSE